MNLNAMQEKIIGYIEADYEKYLDRYGMGKPHVSTEFMDLDRHKRDFTLFIDFNRIGFAKGKFADDCSRSAQIGISVFLVFRNAAPEKLREAMLDGASAFYDLMANCGIAQETAISELNNFSIVEGSKFIAISEFSLTFEMEAS